MDKRMAVQEEISKIKQSIVGYQFRHFKGNLYEVVGIAIHSESAEPMVIYRSASDHNLMWCRPLDMFTSEVDHEKYPDVTQKMRFERLEKFEM